MENYKYEAWDAQGAPYEGVKQAHAQEEVLGWLREQGLTPVSVSPITPAVSQKKRSSVRGKKVKSADLA